MNNEFRSRVMSFSAKSFFGVLIKFVILFFLIIIITNKIIGGEDLRGGFKVGETSIIDKHKDYEWRNYFALKLDLEYDNSTADQILASCVGECQILINPLQIEQDPLEVISPIYSNTKVLHGIEDGHWSFFLADKYGFKENSNNAYESTDLIITGDSHAQAAYISKPDDYVSTIRSETGKTVLNLGVSGQSLIGSALNLLVFGPKDTQKLFIVVSEVNDFLPSPTDNEIKALFSNYSLEGLRAKFLTNIKKKKTLFLSSYNFHSVPHEANQKFSEITYFEYLAFKNLRGLNTISTFLSQGKQVPTQNEIEKRVREAFKIYSRVSSHLRINDVYIVYIPDYLRSVSWNTRFFKTNRQNINDQFKSSVLKSANNQKFKVLDMSKLILKSDNRENCYPFGIEGHLNKRCYNLVAEMIMDEIKN